MSYTGGTTYLHSDPALVKGLSFVAADPSMGDASLSIVPLSPAHTATYQCKVKKSPGVDMRKMSLVVMGKMHIKFHPGFNTCHLDTLFMSSIVDVNIPSLHTAVHSPQSIFF